LADEDLRSVRSQFLGGAKTPERADSEHPGRVRGQHISVRVSDVGDFDRRDIQLPGDFQRGGRIGFHGNAVTGAVDDLETPPGKKFRHDGERRVVGLVRKHGHGDLPPVQGVEKFGDALVEPGLHGIPDAVLGAHEVFQPSDRHGIIDRFGGQRSLDECLQPVSDEFFALLDGLAGVSHPRQRRVHRIGQILDRVEQRSVQVENNSFECHVTVPQGIVSDLAPLSIPASAGYFLTAILGTSAIRQACQAI
jgi:hypothetical protein